MEIADIFTVNKSDRPDADLFVKNLRLMLAPAFKTHYNEIPVIKTIASQKQGIHDLYQSIIHELQKRHTKEKRNWLMAERAWQLIINKRMKDISKEQIKTAVEAEIKSNSFNLYRFVDRY